MQGITSKENEFVKHVKKLKDKKYRDMSNEYVIEGMKLIAEAIQEKAPIKQIILCDDCEKNAMIPKDLMYEIAKHECIYVTEKVFKYLSEVQTPQGILAIIEKNKKDKEIDYMQDIIVALDDVQDPGNLGTILRTVDSVGLTQLLVSKGTADAYNPKVVRSTMGAIFRVKIIECENLKQTLKEIKKHKFKVVVSSLQAQDTIYDIKYNKKVVIIGNEANGVEQEIQALADEKVKIPMLGKTESLNASVATGIILYEYVRQKQCAFGDRH
ncbi:MAG: RNA methyltransferase [Clostridia bacterium]|nr:RNA methyltransferase [Clostridia bacterium]